MSTIDIAVLGPLRVRIDGEPRDIPGEIRQRLLLRLLLGAGGIVSRDDLAETVWADDLPKAWGASLRVHLSKLRELLSAPTTGVEIQAEGVGYRLVLPNDLIIDVRRFEDGLRDSLPDTSVHARIARLADALGLWRDTPWLPLSHHGRAAADADRLEDLRFHGLERYATLLFAEQRFHEVLAAVDFPNAVLATQPVLTDLRMRALVALHRAEDALELYRGIRAVLVNAGLDPAPIITRTYESVLLTKGRADRRYSVDFPIGLLRTGTFIGRSAELDLLTTASTADNTGVVALIMGPGGIGKSRIAAEIAQRTHQQGSLVLHGWAEGDGRPFSLVDEAFRSWAGAWQEPGVDRADFIETLLRHIATDQAVTVVLDDLHLADFASTRVLRKLTRRGLPAGVTFLVTLRPDAVSPHAEELRRELQNSVNTRICLLHGLTEREAEELVRQKVTGMRRTEIWRTAQRLHHHLDGNPLLMELSIENEFDIEQLVERSEVTDLVSPALATLSQETHDALVVVALLSSPVRIQLLAEVLGMSLADTFECINPAVHKGVLLQVGSDRVRFRHHLVRWAIERNWSPIFRATAHHRIAGVLQTWPHADPLELARHRCEALLVHDPPEVVSGIIDEAESAISRLEWDGAAALLERLFTLSASNRLHASDPQWVFRTNLLLGKALDGAADTSGARVAYRRAIEAAQQLSDPVRSAEAAIASAGHSQPLDGDPERIDWLTEVMAVLPHDQDELRLTALAELVYLRAIAGVDGTVLALVAELESLAEHRADPVSRAVAAHGRLLAMVPGSDAESRLQLAEQARGWAHDAEPEIAATAALVACYSALQLGRIDDAAMAVADLEELVEQRQRPGDRWLVQCLRSCLADWRGDFALAARHALLAKRIGDRHEVHTSADAWIAHRFSTAWQSHELGSFAVEDDDLAAASSKQSGTLDAAFALVLLAKGCADAAHDLVTSVVAGLLDRPRDQLWLPTACMAATAAAATRPPRRAELTAALAQHSHLIAVLGVVSVSTLGPVSRYLGLLAEGAGDAATARTWFDQAVQTCEAAGLPVWLAHARADAARVS